MTQVSPEGKSHFPEATLPKNTMTQAERYEQENREYADHEQANLAAIDMQADRFIGSVLGRNLSEVQAKAGVNPDLLIAQADHLLQTAGQIIEGSIDTKVAVRERNQENLGQVVVAGLAKTDFEISEEQKQQRIVDVLIANRNAREGVLEGKVADLQNDIQGYRAFLAETDPAQLIAFDAHFNYKQPASTEIETPTAAALEAQIEHLTDDTMSPARGILLLGSTVLARFVVPAYKWGVDHLTPAHHGVTAEHDRHLQSTR